MEQISKSLVKAVCDRHLYNQDLIAANGKTFCNIFVQRVFESIGYSKLNGKLANQILSFCAENKKDFESITVIDAIIKVVDDFFIIAAREDYPHGHVAIVYPDEPIFSKKWDIFVPRVASVGDRNGVMGANFAFSGKPSYYLFLK